MLILSLPELCLYFRTVLMPHQEAKQHCLRVCDFSQNHWSSKVEGTPEIALTSAQHRKPSPKFLTLSAQTGSRVPSASFVCTERSILVQTLWYIAFWEVRIHRVHFQCTKMLLETLESPQATSTEDMLIKEMFSSFNFCKLSDELG